MGEPITEGVYDAVADVLRTLLYGTHLAGYPEYTEEYRRQKNILIDARNEELTNRFFKAVENGAHRAHKEHLSAERRASKKDNKS